MDERPKSLIVMNRLWNRHEKYRCHIRVGHFIVPDYPDFQHISTAGIFPLEEDYWNTGFYGHKVTYSLNQKFLEVLDMFVDHRIYVEFNQDMDKPYMIMSIHNRDMTEEFSRKLVELKLQGA